MFDVYGHLLPDADDELMDRLDQMAASAEVRTENVLSLSKQVDGRR